MLKIQKTEKAKKYKGQKKLKIPKTVKVKNTKDRNRETILRCGVAAGKGIYGFYQYIFNLFIVIADIGGFDGSWHCPGDPFAQEEGSGGGRCCIAGNGAVI